MKSKIFAKHRKWVLWIMEYVKREKINIFFYQFLYLKVS